MHTDPTGKPYAHNAEQAEAHKLARAEGDGPVSNATARAYLNAYPAEPATIARLREDLEFSRRKGPQYAVVTTQEAISDALAHIAVLSSPNSVVTHAAPESSTQTDARPR